MHEPESDLVRVHFLLFDNFSLLSFSSAIEPLRIANKVLERAEFVYDTVSVDGNSVRASNGLLMEANTRHEDLMDSDLIVLCSSDGVELLDVPASVAANLNRLERHGTQLAGICTGSYLLARLQLLNGRECTIHWEYEAAFREQFPQASVCNSVVVEDGGLLTCSGGTAPLDMMMRFVAAKTSIEAARKTADIAIHHSLRDHTVSQRLELRARLNVPAPKLLRCIGLMEGNIESPLSAEQLCEAVESSLRQLQRLFKAHMGTSPAAYYLELRLQRAHDLLTKTALSAHEIAAATGFNLIDHFSSAYKNEYGTSPFEGRKTRRSKP
jgi:transcriptional regulator GlxA family with amidase domain